MSTGRQPTRRGERVFEAPGGAAKLRTRGKNHTGEARAPEEVVWLIKMYNQSSYFGSNP